MPADSQTTGAQELIERFRRLDQAARTQIAREGLAAGAAIVLAEQQLRAEGLAKSPARSPKTTALPLGAIRGDLRVKFERVDREGFEQCRIGPGEETEHVAYWVEYGHRLVKGGYSKSTYKSGVFAGFRGPGREIGEVDAEPFLRPAFEASADEAVAAVNEREWQVIQEVLA